MSVILTIQNAMIYFWFTLVKECPKTLLVRVRFVHMDRIHNIAAEAQPCHTIPYYVVSIPYCRLNIYKIS